MADKQKKFWSAGRITTLFALAAVAGTLAYFFVEGSDDVLTRTVLFTLVAIAYAPTILQRRKQYARIISSDRTAAALDERARSTSYAGLGLMAAGILWLVISLPIAALLVPGVTSFVISLGGGMLLCVTGSLLLLYRWLVFNDVAMWRSRNPE